MSKKGGKGGGNKTAPKEIKTKSTLLILVGLPGSGKSTFATELEKNGWLRVNQDDLGSADECKKLLDKGLKHDMNVVLDRCNSMTKERKMFITESKNKWKLSEVECLFLDFSADECKKRVRDRKVHPTLAGPDGDAVIDDFLKRFNEPVVHEGFTKLSVAKTTQEVAQHLKDYKAYPKHNK